MIFVDALRLAKKGERVRCDGYMSPGWQMTYIKEAKGFFNINPHTGSTYQFVPQERDKGSTDWNTVPRNQWTAIR